MDSEPLKERSDRLSRRILIFVIASLVAVVLSVTPALAKHGADDGPGHEKHHHSKHHHGKHHHGKHHR